MEKLKRKRGAKTFRLSACITENCRRLLLEIKARHGISEGAAVELGVRAYAAVNNITLPPSDPDAQEGE